MNVAILLPTYNERENIITLLDQIRQVLSKYKKYQYQILVIDDNSPDGTAETVKQYQSRHSEVKLISGKKQGLGKALLRGIKFAVEKMDADTVVQMDADLSHDPQVIPKFLAKIDAGYDFAVGSRYIKGGSIPANWGLHRKIYSIVGNSIVRLGLWSLKVHDWTGGFRAYRRTFVDQIAPEMEPYNGYVFQIAFLYKALSLGAKVAEVPIHFSDRKYGRSKIIFSEYIMHIFEFILKERYRSIVYGAFGKFLVVGGIGLFINTVLLEVFVRSGLAPWIANLIGAECAITSNFILNNIWTFGDRTVRGPLKLIYKFIQFNLTSAVGVVFIQTGTIWLGTNIYGVDSYRIWYVVGTGLLVFWNYFMYSRVIWNRK